MNTRTALQPVMARHGIRGVVEISKSIDVDLIPLLDSTLTLPLYRLIQPYLAKAITQGSMAYRVVEDSALL